MPVSARVDGGYLEIALLFAFSKFLFLFLSFVFLITNVIHAYGKNKKCACGKNARPVALCIRPHPSNELFSTVGRELFRSCLFAVD